MYLFFVSRWVMMSTLAKAITIQPGMSTMWVNGAAFFPNLLYFKLVLGCYLKGVIIIYIYSYPSTPHPNNLGNAFETRCMICSPSLNLARVGWYSRSMPGGEPRSVCASRTINNKDGWFRQARLHCAPIATHAHTYKVLMNDVSARAREQKLLLFN